MELNEIFKSIKTKSDNYLINVKNRTKENVLDGKYQIKIKLFFKDAQSGGYSSCHGDLSIINTNTYDVIFLGRMYFNTGNRTLFESDNIDPKLEVEKEMTLLNSLYFSKPQVISYVFDKPKVKKFLSISYNSNTPRDKEDHFNTFLTDWINK